MRAPTSVVVKTVISTKAKAKNGLVKDSVLIGISPDSRLGLGTMAKKG